MKTNEYWAVIDLNGTYIPSISSTRYAARRESDYWRYITDAKFVVRKVRVVEVKKK